MSKFSKKLIALFLAAAMTMSFVACGKDKPAEEPSDTTVQTETAEKGYFTGDDAEALMKPLADTENPNKIDMTALAVFKNAVTREMGKTSGRIERGDTDTKYCTHGSMQALSTYKLDYDTKGAKDAAAPITATYSVAPNSEISDIIHYKLTCNSTLQKGTASSPAVATYSELQTTLDKIEGDMLLKGLSPELLSKATITQEVTKKPVSDDDKTQVEKKGNVIIDLQWTDDAELKIMGKATAIAAPQPKGKVVCSAKMELDTKGKIVSLRVSKDVVDETGAKFALSSSDYKFKNMAGKAAGKES
ncbi:MAG: hypothetical protein RR205_04340 [Oscillospiraceae bacterium]